MATTVTRDRVLQAPASELWEVVGDPFHLPRWWPRVQRVEGFDGESFTQILSTSKGKGVRADFRLLESEQERLMRWEQELANTPFEKVLKSAHTEIRLEEQGAGTLVTLTQSHSFKGKMAAFGARKMKGVSEETLENALTQLAQIVEP